MSDRQDELRAAISEAQTAAEKAKDAVYNEEPTAAEFGFGQGIRAVYRWKRAKRRLNAAIAEAAEKVPYA